MDQGQNLRQNLRQDNMLDHDDDEVIDVAWIEKHERLLSVEQVYVREPQNNIQITFIYINKDDYINKIICETVPVVNGSISYQTLVQLINGKKRLTPTSKYKFDTLATFFIDLDADQVQPFVNNIDFKTENGFFRANVPFLDGIRIPDSIFLFHELNSLFVIFREIDLEHNRHTVKSILKKAVETNNGKTKKKKCVGFMKINKTRSK